MAAASPESHTASPALQRWHADFAAALMARDAAVYLAFIAPDCSVQINNGMPVYSKLALEHAYTTYLTLFRSLDVEVLSLHGDGSKLSIEALLNYGLNDGSKEVVQCAYFIDRNDAGLITSVRLYGNASRVLKPFMRPKE